MDPLTAWTLAAMVKLQPEAPWRGTYDETAQVISRVAADSPLFTGDDGPRKTAALLVSVAWFESTFKPDALGDKGKSVCLFQIHESNHKSLGVTRDELLTNRETCVRTGRKLMQISFGVCRDRPVEDHLGQYAAGGSTCGGSKGEGLRESRHRVWRGQWLFRSIPWDDARKPS